MRANTSCCSAPICAPDGPSSVWRAAPTDSTSPPIRSPFLTPAPDGPFAAYEEFGVEDPRVTPLEGEYLITYSAYSRNGVRIALAKTKDFKQVERVSLITEADYRNVVIFPEKFDGLYARLDRPHSEIAPWSIWISYSPDLRFWGESQLIMRPVHRITGTK
jgi:predicted GH43/DUF377 family glycosyl hydrolase